MLDDKNRQAVFASEGLGHAFMALSSNATVLYLCSTPYTPAREHGVHPLDPTLGIGWPSDMEPILSSKDASAPSLEEALRSGQLPLYNDCIAHRTRLKANGSRAAGGFSIDS
jgi:dTDP-4-dehydrorhamnose 3,5-epimerase